MLNLRLKPSIKERSLKAFLDLVILRVLIDQPMTAYEVNHYLTRKYGIFIRPQYRISQFICNGEERVDKMH
jgi:hypothetical protein